jgi:dTDP-4-dehydrorhamnose 3,5-epimerase
METWRADEFAMAGIPINFVQDNQSMSKRGVLRGLHFQKKNPQGKLVRVISGEVYDVAVDLRKNSVTFGKWYGIILNAENKKQFFIPEGFAHGFLVLSETAEYLYKCTNYYDPNDESGIFWNDPNIGIDWPVNEINVMLSEKDKQNPRLENLPLSF